MRELLGARGVKGGYGVQCDHAVFVRVDLVSRLQNHATCENSVHDSFWTGETGEWLGEKKAGMESLRCKERRNVRRQHDDSEYIDDRET